VKKQYVGGRQNGDHPIIQYAGERVTGQGRREKSAKVVDLYNTGFLGHQCRFSTPPPPLFSSLSLSLSLTLSPPSLSVSHSVFLSLPLSPSLPLPPVLRPSRELPPDAGDSLPGVVEPMRYTSARGSGMRRSSSCVDAVKTLTPSSSGASRAGSSTVYFTQSPYGPTISRISCSGPGPHESHVTATSCQNPSPARSFSVLHQGRVGPQHQQNTLFRTM
jgi:hypothetical protein